MTMSVAQVRLPRGLLQQVDELVEKGIYASKSDVFRDAIRRLILDKLTGIIPAKGDSVKEVKAIRTKLSAEKWDAKRLNKSAD